MENCDRSEENMKFVRRDIHKRSNGTLSNGKPMDGRMDSRMN
ncbi:MAG: hypothetical protein ABJG41_01120 [Cyclobacteriaceae bacterium]